MPTKIKFHAGTDFAMCWPSFNLLLATRVSLTTSLLFAQRDQCDCFISTR